MSSGREHHYRIPAGWQDVEIAVANSVLIEQQIFPEQLLERVLAPERGHIRLPATHANSFYRYLVGLVTDTGAKAAVAVDQVLAQELRKSILRELANAVEAGLQHEESMQFEDVYQRYALVRQVEHHITSNLSQLDSSRTVYEELG